MTDPAPTGPETDEERDARFAPGNDAIWGEGNWIRCDICPPDSEGRAVYHHRDAHLAADLARRCRNCGQRLLYVDGRWWHDANSAGPNCPYPQPQAADPAPTGDDFCHHCGGGPLLACTYCSPHRTTTIDRGDQP